MLKKQKRIFQNRNNPTFCEVIKKNILTEKSSDKLDNQSTYIFEVQQWANKIMVRHAVANLFHVRVEKVNILNTPGKEKKTKMGTYKTPMRKIAMVKINANDVILLEKK